VQLIQQQHQLMLVHFKQSHSTPPTASMLAHAANSSDTPNKHQPFRRQSTSKSGASPGHAKKNTMFVLDALANRLDNITKANEIQSTYGGAQDNAAFERCQYMSKLKGGSQCRYQHSLWHLKSYHKRN
jgi:hypothetical protein